jgi:hypothetical protein
VPKAMPPAQASVQLLKLPRNFRRLVRAFLQLLCKIKFASKGHLLDAFRFPQLRLYRPEIRWLQLVASNTDAVRDIPSNVSRMQRIAKNDADSATNPTSQRRTRLFQEDPALGTPRSLSVRAIANSGARNEHSSVARRRTTGRYQQESAYSTAMRIAANAFREAGAAGR